MSNFKTLIKSVRLSFKCRGVFRNQSNICNRFLLKIVHYFSKKFLLKGLTGFWMRLWYVPKFYKVRWTKVQCIFFKGQCNIKVKCHYLSIATILPKTKWELQRVSTVSPSLCNRSSLPTPWSLWCWNFFSYFYILRVSTEKVLTLLFPNENYGCR